MVRWARGNSLDGAALDSARREQTRIRTRLGILCGLYHRGPMGGDRPSPVGHSELHRIPSGSAVAPPPQPKPECTRGFKEET